MKRNIIREYKNPLNASFDLLEMLFLDKDSDKKNIIIQICNLTTCFSMKEYIDRAQVIIKQSKKEFELDNIVEAIQNTIDIFEQLMKKTTGEIFEFECSDSIEKLTINERKNKCFITIDKKITYGFFMVLDQEFFRLTKYEKDLNIIGNKSYDYKKMEVIKDESLILALPVNELNERFFGEK